MRTHYFSRLFAACMLFVALASAVQPTPAQKQKPKSKKTQVKKAPDKVTRMQMPVQVGEPSPMVAIETKFGTMVVRLFNETPQHRDNFVRLVKDSFYNDLLFHRVIKDFMIQGGDPTSRNAAPGVPLGNGGPGYTIPAEINPNLWHRPGVLAAARDNNPARASSGSQFYIVQGRIFTPDELVKIQNSNNMRGKTELLNVITKSDSVQARVNDFMLRGDKEGMNAYFKGLQPIIDSIYEKQEVKFTPEQVMTYTKQGGAPFLDMSYTVFGEVISGYEVIDSIAAVKTGPNDRPEEDVKMRMRMLTK